MPRCLPLTLKQYPVTEVSSAYVNDKMLEMLSAYDQDACCKEELLKCCEMTVDALEAFRGSRGNPDKSISNCRSKARSY